MVVLVAYLFFLFFGMNPIPDIQQFPSKEYFSNPELLRVSGYGASRDFSNSYGALQRADVLFFGAKQGCFVLLEHLDGCFPPKVGEYIVVQDYESYHGPDGASGSIVTEYACRVTDVTGSSDGCIISYSILYVLGKWTVPSYVFGRGLDIPFPNGRNSKATSGYVRRLRRTLVESCYHRYDSVSGEIIPIVGNQRY